ncbi:MAG: ChbG/HpnK family deacetylase [Bacteroidota bacterium]
MDHRVIVTADDFGACNFIDDGIREALKKGMVSSVSALINFEPRTKDHPHGEYEGSVSAVKRLLHDLNHNDKYKLSRNVRIGLHFNFHAGSPVSDPGEIEDLLEFRETVFKRKKRGRHKGQPKINFKGEKKVKRNKKDRPIEIAGKPIFKLVDDFNPSAISIKQFKKELLAQYNKFEQSFGFDPDHLSCHFPVIFMAPKMFKEVCKLAKDVRKGKEPVPVRNPILVWQNSKKWVPESEKEDLKKSKKFWKDHSEARKEVDLKTKLANADKLFDIFLNKWRKKAIKNLNENKVSFPDYTNCNLYGNGGKQSKIIRNIIERRLDFRPKIYKKSDDKPLTTEIIVHLGKGNLEKAKMMAPNGINADYFAGRARELDALLSSKDLVRVKTENNLLHFQFALDLKKHKM